MFGVILFWLHYIVATILLWHILRCIYIKQPEKNSRYNNTYIKTSDDKRLKHPLWVVLLFGLIFLIPVLNIVVFGIYLGFRMINEDGSERNPYYCKSIFTKEY